MQTSHKIEKVSTKRSTHTHKIDNSYKSHKRNKNKTRELKRRDFDIAL